MCDGQWASVVSSLRHRFVRHYIQLENHLIFEQYISIHARHSDFGEYCGDLPKDQCFASPAIIGRRIEEVRQELRERKNMEVQHVVMTSDERNATWWEDIKKQGWLMIDHSQTVELYGHWYAFNFAFWSIL
jgi:hypothetical protein